MACTYFTLSTQLGQYLQYPRFLLDIPISETAKLVFILILDRTRLSVQNKWIDDEGHVYCRYPIKTLAVDAHKCKTTIINVLAELEAHDLLVRHRGGAGYANKLYLRLPETCTSDGQVSGPDCTRKPAPNNKTKTKYKANYDYKGGGL